MNAKVTELMDRGAMHWIDVNEGLPKDDEDVLVSDGVEISLAQYTREPRWKGWYGPSTIDTGDGSGIDIEVRYWMPLDALRKMLSQQGGENNE